MTEKEILLRVLLDAKRRAMAWRDSASPSRQPETYNYNEGYAEAMEFAVCMVRKILEEG